MTLALVQVLRAAAAAMVVWHHARHEVDLLAAGGVGRPLEPATLLPWWAGVDLFFVISGFVIVLASRELFAVRGGRTRFLAHRVARVLPLYWLVTALYLGLGLARPGLLGAGGASVRDPGAILASFLFWPAARPDGTVQPLFGLGWTLNYEMFFYALFSVGLGLGRRGATLGLCAALTCLVAAGALLPDLGRPLAFWSDPIVLEFAFGAGLALWRGEGLRLSRGVRLALAGAGCLGLGLAAGLLGGTGEAGGFFRPLLVGLPAVLLVAAAALGPARDRAQVRRMPAPLRGLVVVGDASYALYLVHPFALRLMRQGLLSLGSAGALHPWGDLWLMLGVSVAAALAVHRFVEAPLVRLARRALDPGAPQKDVRVDAAAVPSGRGDR